LTLEIVEINSCKRNLVAEVPETEVEEEINRLARRYAAQAKVPGFRPGKVPMNIIRQRYGADLRADATQEIIHRIWKETVQEHGLEPLAEPVVEKIEADAGNPLKFVLAFEIAPKLESIDYNNITVTMSPPAIPDSDVEATLDHLRDQHAQYIPVEGSGIRDGHFVTVSLDGEFEGGGKPIHEDNVTLLIGAPHTNREFSEKLQGALLDDDLTFDVTYPDDYRQKRLAGKCIHYRVKVKEIKEKQVVELNDDFARDVGAASVEELRNRIRDDLVTKAQQAAEEKTKEAALDQVVQRLSFDVPEIMVREELEDNARRIASNLASQGIDVTKTSIDWKKIFEEGRPHAEQSVRRRLVLEALARQEKLDVTEQDLDAEFQKMAGGGGRSAAAFRAQFEKDQRLQAFRMFLLQNKALDFIVRNANISEG
jgi:trigger factor